MKKYFLRISLMVSAMVMVFSSCKDELDVINPNQPTTDVLNSEAAITRLALGVYQDGIGSLNYLWLVQGYHEAMGDAIYISAGNFAWRWANQATSITLDDGTVVNPPQGTTQPEELILRNSRAFGDDNAFYHEWFTMYQANNTANLLLQQVDKVEFSGDAETKKNTLKAWAHWWKGFAYSRIGSMYSAGIIVDEFGVTNTNYVTNAEIINEATKQFDLAIALLNGLDGGAEYETILLKAIPDFTNDGLVPSPQEWIRNINTMKARNILVNTKRRDMSSAQWNEVLALAGNGLQAGDFTFLMKQDDIFVTTGWLPYRFFIGWHFLSERLVQDYPEGDQRRARNVTALPAARVNASGRGLLYGTRWNFVDIANGGDVASTAPGLSKLYLAGSYEENELMKAESKIFTGNLSGAAADINTVRTFQNSGLAPLTGTSQEQMVEALRKERRVALLLRGLPFYDARRWGVTEPVSQGGGRTAIILSGSPANLKVNTSAVINYNYLDYWGVPQNEIEFNAPGVGSADVNPQ